MYTLRWVNQRKYGILILRISQYVNVSHGVSKSKVSLIKWYTLGKKSKPRMNKTKIF